MLSVFINIVLKIGPKTRLNINYAFKMGKEVNTKLIIDKEKDFEVSMAILGTSLAILNGKFQAITKKRGQK